MVAGKYSNNGIAYPNPHCDKSPTSAHHYIVVEKDIWECKYCHIPIWAPVYLSDSEKFATQIRFKGIQRAYIEAVHHRPEVRKKIRALESIRND